MHRSEILMIQSDRAGSCVKQALGTRKITLKIVYYPRADVPRSAHLRRSIIHFYRNRDYTFEQVTCIASD